ncbi:MAG TPA: fatty acid desaturase [Candidatus Methylomirabilis sp.]|nr:fatty acid desaturase [Candidatus Methylomirabilis sp.]
MERIPSASEIRSQLAGFAKPDTRKGAVLFLVDLFMYLGAITAVLFAPWILAKLAAGVVAGIKMGNLITLAHDAAHNSLTSSRKLNKLIAVVSFTPGLFNYRLWIYDHHNLHHQKTNEDHPDSYTPLSKNEFDALSYWGKIKQRFYRLPTLWVFGIYYIVERWWQVKFIPRARIPAEVRRESWPHAIYLVGYLLIFLALLAYAPTYSDTPLLQAILFGFVVPFYVFQSLFAFTVYVQHTHPRVAWFKGRPDRNGDGRQDLISVNLVFPKWYSYLTHYVYDHAAHHVNPAIPCYRLPEAQAKLNEMLGPLAVSEKFSFAWLRQAQRRCKLYDFEQHRWLDFEGRPTSRVTLSFEADLLRPVYAFRAV